MKRIVCLFRGHVFGNRVVDEDGVLYFFRCGRCGRLYRE